MKITLATVKSFIRKNEGNLLINVKSSFDGMTDCCEPVSGGFQKAEKDHDCADHSLGIQGAWFVKSSRDYFKPYSDNEFQGIEVSNCCGHFILASPKKNIN